MAADCAALGVPGQFDVFARQRTANTGERRRSRAASPPAATPSSPGITIGTDPPLTPDANRADLVVGDNLTVDGGGGRCPTAR